MKRIIVTVISITTLFILSTNVHAGVKGAFGACLGYGIDAGNIEEAEIMDIESEDYDHTSYKRPEILQLSVLGRISFFHVLFLRTGIDYNMTVMKGEAVFDKNDLGTQGDVKIEYSTRSYTIPFLIGINAPVIGSVDVYLATGPAYMSITNKREYDVDTNDRDTIVDLTDTKYIEVKASGRAWIFILGVDFEVAPNLYLLMEMERYIFTDLGESTTKNWDGSRDKDKTVGVSNNCWTARFGLQFMFGG